MAHRSNAVQFRYGFRVVGDCSQPRRLVDHQKAFVACCEADPRSEPDRESYLSAFRFGDDFRDQLERAGSTRGFGGPCRADWIWWDIDRADDLRAAHDDARRLAVTIADRLGVAESDVLVFYSGSKGFHVGVPTALWAPEPGDDFHKIARRFAETLAEQAEVVIDAGVYDKVRCFRSPNSRHPKTGLHKRRLSVDQLAAWSLDAILEHSKTPAPFGPPEPAGKSEAAATLWAECTEQVRREAEVKAVRRANANGDRPSKLNQTTIEFVRDGAGVGDRHRLLFSASANLAEFGAPLSLCVALLEEPALDSGLPPKDANRGIRCGWASVQQEVKRVCEGVGGTVFDVQAVTPVNSPKAGPTPPTPPATARTAKPDAEPKAVLHG